MWYYFIQNFFDSNLVYPGSLSTFSQFVLSEGSNLSISFDNSSINSIDILGLENNIENIPNPGDVIWRTLGICLSIPVELVGLMIA